MMTALAKARQRIREIGPQLSPDILAEIQALFTPLQLAADAEIQVKRDLAYGEHPRHRLNLFLPQNADRGGADILIFVHGGGFVAGDKDEVPGVFYDNVGLWAARQGMIGVTINYRLAPQHSWPAGRDDVAAACDWVATHIGQYGGNPQRIFLMGHSAGAAHVAAVAARPEDAQRLAGCICVSGIYDLSIAPVNPAYFGPPEQHMERSPLDGLAGTTTPLLVVLAQFDPEFIQQHGISLLRKALSVQKQLPAFVQLWGHNHFSSVLHLNSDDPALGNAIRAFTQQV